MTAITVPVGPKDGLEASWRKAVADAINADTTDIASINARNTSGAGAPAGTGTDGYYYYDTTNKRLWRSNGSQWIFQQAYDTTKRAGVVLSDSARSVATGTTTDITWTTEVSDVDGWITAPGATLTIPAGWGGVYAFNFRTAWSSSALGTTPSAWILYNGSALWGNTPLGAVGLCTVSGLFVGAAAGDTIKCQVVQNSGAGVTVSSVLAIEWLYR